MSVPVLTFFNNKSGVKKTSLVYHLSWMFTELNLKVVVMDLDAQANLTAAYLDEDELENLWELQSGPTTIYRAIEPLMRMGDLEKPRLVEVTSQLHLVPGDVALVSFEDTLSEAWLASLGYNNLYRPFRILTSFWQIAQMTAQQVEADIILLDVGPNLGPINRSALIASDYIVIPLVTDIFSLRCLYNLGPTLHSWRSLWEKRLDNWKSPGFELPQGKMNPLGYVIQQYSLKHSRPITAYDKWFNRMPGVYHEQVLRESTDAATPGDDLQCLAILRHFRSLVQIAQEARKPIFKLTPADGAIGSHSEAVFEAYKDFKRLAERLLEGMKKLQSTPGKP